LRRTSAKGEKQVVQVCQQQRNKEEEGSTAAGRTRIDGDCVFVQHWQRQLRVAQSGHLRGSRGERTVRTYIKTILRRQSAPQREGRRL